MAGYYWGTLGSQRREVLTNLDLCSNDLYTEGGKALAKALEVNAVLTKLNLNGFELNIAQLRGTEPVETLDLSRKGLGVASGIVIAKLRVNALITTLATMQIVRLRPLRGRRQQCVVI